MLLLLPIMDCCTKKRLLTSMTSVCACAAFGLLSIAVATDYWLFTSEKKKDAAKENNGTAGAIYYLHGFSGLWHQCLYTDTEPPECKYIMYFTGDEDREGLGPTDAILLNIRRATVFPLVSLLILLIAGIMCFIGHCHATRKVLTFVSGILFVLAGLCTLVGIILYIGSITEEVGNKPRASIEEPKFSYTYGSSFIMAVGSFVLTELSGVFAVYLYITRHKQAQRKKMQALKAHQHNDRGPGTWRYRKPTRDREGCGHTTPTPSSRERSQSRDRSRDPSASRSDTYFTYTPISDTSHELSNYTFQRDATDNTISTTAEMHMPRIETSYIGATAPSIDIVRRTTPV
ncbi:voltage-dependent calcium channel gamma-7 subunit-like [Babylonia areolata]|uniref:voltage-dependent calcium channel gamma-7 subunit-like n=1 Tax=Babylonia areolata TaxID=304850 RepID=UPI003FD2737F